MKNKKKKIGVRSSLVLLTPAKYITNTDYQTIDTCGLKGRKGLLVLSRSCS